MRGSHDFDINDLKFVIHSGFKNFVFNLDRLAASELECN